VSGWTRVVEPPQQAFSIEIPQDWRLLAGVPPIRPTSPSFAMSSPDGAVVMIYNQIKLLGLGEFPVSGTPVFHPTAYVPAPYFIIGFGATLVGEQCSSPRLQRVRLRNDISSRIEAAFPGRGQSVAADAMFSCERAGKPSLAFMAVGTNLFPSGPTMGTWQIDFEEIVVAPSGQIAAAIAIMNRSWSSIQWSQAWVEAQQQVQLGQMQASMRALVQTLHDSHQVDNIINGVGDYFNPATNATIQAPVGFDRYCQDGLGLVIGTNGSEIKPNCQPLTPAR
jgi:hypothetical protein